MTEPADVATKDAYEGAIRSFTEAEIALREIVGGLQRFRSASEELAESTGALAETRASVEDAADAVSATVVALTAVAGSLATATKVIAELDPARFWAALERLEGSSTTTQTALTTGFNEAVEGRAAAADTTRAEIQASTTSITAELHAVGDGVGTALAEEARATRDGIAVTVIDAEGRLAAQARDDASAARDAAQKTADALSADVAAVQRLATQVRMMAGTSIAVGGIAVVLLIIVLLR
jgi:hypothetical protein